jgi:thiamine-phosphate pyrophosphorylase
VTLPDPPILVITDRLRSAEPIESRALALFEGGCRWLSLRESDLKPAARLTLLARLVEVGRPFGAVIEVHRDLEAARCCEVGLHLPSGADGKHARSTLGPRAILGQSCHSAREVEAAELVDYVTLSPAFATDSKPGYGPALGPAGLLAVAEKCSVPILALGGITSATVPLLQEAGVAGVAVMGAAMSTPEPRAWFAALARNWTARGVDR